MSDEETVPSAHYRQPFTANIFQESIRLLVFSSRLKDGRMEGRCQCNVQAVNGSLRSRFHGHPQVFTLLSSCRFISFSLCYKRLVKKRSRTCWPLGNAFFCSSPFPSALFLCGTVKEGKEMKKERMTATEKERERRDQSSPTFTRDP